MMVGVGPYVCCVSCCGLLDCVGCVQLRWLCRGRAPALTCCCMFIGHWALLSGVYAQPADPRFPAPPLQVRVCPPGAVGLPQGQVCPRQEGRAEPGGVRQERQREKCETQEKSPMPEALAQAESRQEGFQGSGRSLPAQ
jgi:hypothetical protein